MAVYQLGHRGVIEPSHSDNASQCSSALLLPGESIPATEQEEELGKKHRQFECVKHAILVVTDD